MSVSAELRRSASNPFEMRQSPRVALSAPARLRLAHPGGMLPCRLRDLGPEGACVQTNTVLALEEVRELCFDLEEGPVTTPVDARWHQADPMSRSWLMGVRFTKPEALKAAGLRRVVERATSELVHFLLDESELAHLSYDEALDVALGSRLREVPAGAWIVREGHPSEAADAMFVVTEGSIQLETSERVARRLTFESIGKGGVFGGLGLLADVPPPLSAMASRPTTMLELDRGSFKYLARAKPIVAMRLTELIVQRSISYLRAAIDRATTP